MIGTVTIGKTNQIGCAAGQEKAAQSFLADRSLCGEEGETVRRQVGFYVCFGAVIALFLGAAGWMWSQRTQAPELVCVEQAQVEYQAPLSVYSLVTTLSGERPVTLTLESSKATAEPDGTSLSFDQIGLYDVVVTAADAKGRETRCTVSVQVVDTQKPVLTVPTIEIPYGTQADYYAGVEAVDGLDGDLTQQIKVDTSAVDEETPGVYLVTYAVADASGNVATVTTTATVLPAQAEAVTLDQTKQQLSGNGYVTLSATVAPADWTGTVVWSSSDESVAVVSGGQVTWMGEGTAIITASAGDVSAECEIICGAVQASAVRLNYHKVTLQAEGEVDLSATVLPSNYQGTVTWESSNPSVATVKNGKIVWAGSGSCIITARAGGVSDRCTVTCEKKPGAGNFLSGLWDAIFGG
jgi:hypothetical protein